jgi:uroporphyrinogen-III synthase
MVQESFSLKGKTIAVTRPRGQTEEIGKIIEERGGKPCFIPTIEIKGPSDLEPIKKLIHELWNGKVDYVIFMSVNGIKSLLSAAESLGLLNEMLSGLKKTVTIAVGPRTANELKAHQIEVNFVPLKYTSEGILQILRQRGVSGKIIRIPRTSKAKPILKEQLKEMGALIQEIYVYESALPTDQEGKATFFQNLIAENIDAIVFGSALSVKYFFQMLCDQILPEKLRDLLNTKVAVVAIGPVTADALSEIGVNVDVIPERYLFEEAIDALARYWHSG